MAACRSRNYRLYCKKKMLLVHLLVVYGLTNFIDTDELALVGGANEVAMVMGLHEGGSPCLSDV